MFFCVVIKYIKRDNAGPSHTEKNDVSFAVDYLIQALLMTNNSPVPSDQPLPTGQ
jgi:hypothetical protein